MSRIPKKQSPLWPGLLMVVALLILALFLRKKPADHVNQSSSNSSTSQSSAPTNDAGLVRNPTHIHYSKHAKCRMQCRHIDESEVAEILASGSINYRKSELGNSGCNNRYAVEGKTHDGQEVRIIFAPCNTDETVVTVIDLGTEWTCDCK